MLRFEHASRETVVLARPGVEHASNDFGVVIDASLCLDESELPGTGCGNDRDIEEAIIRLGGVIVE